MNDRNNYVKNMIDGPRCRVLMLPLSPVPISRGRTVIFDIVEYIIMEWTMPNESRICRICRRGLIKKKRVLLASLPQSRIGQKRIAGLKN